MWEDRKRTQGFFQGNKNVALMRRIWDGFWKNEQSAKSWKQESHCVKSKPCSVFEISHCTSSPGNPMDWPIPQQCAPMLKVFSESMLSPSSPAHHLCVDSFCSLQIDFFPSLFAHLSLTPQIITVIFLNIKQKNPLTYLKCFSEPPSKCNKIHIFYNGLWSPLVS